jgi:hypothetical protein
MITVGSCIKDTINLDKISKVSTYNGTITVPLAYGELTMKDIIESNDTLSMVKFYPTDSLLYIQYKEDVFSKKAEDFVILKNQSFVEVIQPIDPGFPTFPAIPSPPPIVYSDTTYYDFGVTNGEELDSLIIKSGVLDVNVQSTFHNTGSLKFTVPNLTKNNIPYQLTVPITKADGTFNSAPVYTDLSGYKFQVIENNNFNKVKIVYEITLNSGGAVSSSYAATIRANITNPKFSALYGYLGKRELDNSTGMITMSVFDIKDQSNVVFNDPHLITYVRNTFGVPLSVDFHDMQLYSVLKNQYYALTVPTPNYISAAKSITQPGFDTITIDKGTINSNLATLMNNVPRDLYYGIRTTINPVGKPRNFVTDTSTFKSSIDIELPLDLYVTQYVYKDTIDFDLAGAIKDYSIIDSLSIYTKFENRFPLEARFQLIFVDDNYNVIDSLYNDPSNQPVIKAAPIITSGPNAGRVGSVKPDEIIVRFTQARIKNFELIKKALMRVAIYTKSSDQKTFVKFYLRDNLKISIGAKATLNIKNTDQL